jgi:hypothetical protein
MRFSMGIFYQYLCAQAVILREASLWDGGDFFKIRAPGTALGAF